MAQPVLQTYELDNLDSQRVIRQLALEWIQSKLPADEITFVDCLKVLGHLQTTTRNIHQTETIFGLIFSQANALGKSSEWMAQELQFENLALTVANRQELIRLYLYQQHPVNDTALDEYNDRMNRFID